MKNIISLAAVFGTATLMAATPFIDRDSVSLSQDPKTTEVTIRYRLTGAEAIVTVDIQTNVNRSATGSDDCWLSIGEKNFRNVTGDVNLLIQPSDSEDRVIKWNPGETMPTLRAMNKSCRAVVRAWAKDAPPDYLVVDLRRDKNRLATDPRIRYYVSTNAFPEADNVQDDVYRNDYLAMRLIKARGRTFRMGSLSSEKGRSDKEDLHNVTFANQDFYCAVYPLTIGQTLNIGYLGAYDKAGILDIRLDGCSWDYTIYQYHQVQPTFAKTNNLALICNWANLRGRSEDSNPDWPTTGHAVYSKSILGQLRTRTGVEFDLPTDAQWEYCCRAGTLTPIYGAKIEDIAWIDGNSGKLAPEVGKLQPNSWGLYDMLGNVFEYCLDWYSDHLGTLPVVEPVGVTEQVYSGGTGCGRVMRGGNYVYSWTYARSPYRSSPGLDKTATQKAGARLVVPVGLKWPTEADNRMLTASYSLDADTIVTVDVQTNRTGAATADAADWVSIGEENFTDVFGDVNCKVAAGTDKKVYWRADETWPGHIFADGAIRMVVKKWADTNPPDYLVIDLRSNDDRGSTGSRERYYSSAKALPYGGVTNRLYKYQFMAMRRIPAQGVRWCMGSPTTEGQSARSATGEVQHYVTFKQEDFYAAVYPVTCGQLDLIGGVALSTWNTWTQFYDMSLIAYTPTPMRGWPQIRGATGTDWPNDGHTVTSDSYLGKLITLDGGRVFDLPTDAQWEFLCRAGSGDAWYHTPASDAGWFDSNSSKQAHEVGLKKPNDWGIYDLHGCLWEIVLDWYGDMTADAVEDPQGPTSGTSRVYRGGNGSYASIYGRCASRYGGNLGYCCGLYGQFRPITPISGKWVTSE